MNSPERLFLNGGEMGQRMSAIDWSRTPLGPVERWPLGLRTCVRIVLTSRQPMFVWWGEHLINLYNDAYKSIVGGKHPAALAQPASEVWRELWDQIGPRAESALVGNEGTYDEALLLIMERHGYPEETYYTFSYSPVPNDQGGTGGLLCANTDDTQRILGARQLATLRELATRSGDARTREDACVRCAEVLATNAHDLPFALVYLSDPERKRLVLMGSAGIASGSRAAPAEVALDRDTGSPWPLAAVMRAQQISVISNVDSLFPGLPTGVWRRPPSTAAVIPIAPSGDTGRAGVLVVGLNPYRKLDDTYRGFLGLIASQIAASVANAQAHEEETKRAEALAEIDRAKTAFFSNVSHEFRTPLTLMLGPTEEALATPGGGLSGTQLEMVHRNELRLLKLVNTLLDFARIEAGRVRAAFEPTNLSSLTADLASAFRATIERGGLGFEVDCPPLAAPIAVDRDMWEKIVLNLLSNAFKFTFEGTIRIALRLAGDHIELSVVDTGVGIPEAEQPRVFERFHRIKGMRSRTHEGSGIGLALVRDLVKLHRGDIRVVSEVGRGTSFTVSIPVGSIPVASASPPGADALPAIAVHAQSYVAEALRWLPEGRVSGSSPPSSTSRRSSAPTPPRARVLVADDNADMRDYVTRLLCQHWAVESAADGALALEAALRQPPDLVLADVMMPGLDGFELVHALRADPRTATIPIILLSARAGEEATAEGLRSGADDYLVKPFSASALVVRVESQLAGARARAEARSETERARAEAESANRAKDEFLAMLGHELRNPLSPILTAIHVMRLRGVDGAEKECTVIERQVGHLVRLIDDLLDVSRITRGKIHLKKERVEIASVVAKAIEMASPLLEEREHNLTIGVPQRGLAVHGDPTRLAQIVSNLLANAAKYTERAGSITVAAHRSGDEVVIEIVDNGIGIAPEMLPRVFDMFVQERQTIDRSQGGLGLGLAIVRSLTTLHGGSVSATSDGVGDGSQFVVRLPAAAASEGEAVAIKRTSSASQAPPPPGEGGLRILLVDDNEDAAEMLAEGLSEMGHAVCVVHDGPSALRAVADFIPDVALLDIGLPVMDGYELARRLRADPRLAGARLVAITGYGQSKDRELSRAAGFDDHLVKPVDLARLQKLIASAAASG